MPTSVRRLCDECATRLATWVNDHGDLLCGDYRCEQAKEYGPMLARAEAIRKGEE